LVTSEDTAGNPELNQTTGPAHLAVPERVRRLRDDLLSAQNSTCFERAQILTRSYRRTEGEPQVVRRARALHAVLSEIPIFIREGELLVGQRAAELGARAVYPEFHMHGLTMETTPAEVWDYWQGRTLFDLVRGVQPERLRRAERELAAGFCTGADSGFGHVVVDYEKAITRGFRAIGREAEERLAEAPADDREGRHFLEAVIISADGIIAWSEPYAVLAEAMAETEPNAARAEELQQIARACRRVPAEPARSFHEALQAFWFVHLAMHIEQYGWSISAGRFDQYVYPFYRADLDSGRLTHGESWELLLGLWVKFMENVGTAIGDTLFQNMTLGGQDLEGSDLSNELSHLCIDATLALQVPQPAISVRWHSNIDPAFWDHANRALAQGLGLPALFNDEVIIPALVAHGVEPDDALGYAIVGCVEPSVPGKQQGLTAGGNLNMAKALELALNEGRSMITGSQIGPETPPPEQFRRFDDLWGAYKDQIEHLCGLNVLATLIAGEAQKRYVPCPLMSSLLDDCLEQRQDLVLGGTRYNLPGTAIFGPSNVCDGMTAIRRFVCEEGRITWRDLRKALQNDFEGHEPMRQMLRNGAPRFGNDDAEADEMANRLTAIHSEFLWKHVDSRNGRYTCGVWPVQTHVYTGYFTAATPDGRRKGQPLVDGVGACQGADREGPTALLQSVARLDNIRHWPAGNVCNLKLSAGSMRTPAGIANLKGLTTGFMRLKGQELQVNVVDAATLRAAQKDPEAHAGLLVRVAGFSAYFVQLDHATQNEIIARTEHAV
jgi:formate C-acetyltransferase